MEEFTKKVEQIEDEFEVAEIKVSLQTGGFIAGKFWGDKSVRPFVCLHGWMDNAASFDRLIPLLPKEHSYLAIDFPGHGRSSWLPNGVAYHNIDFVFVLAELMKEYKWSKISIIAHSMGAHIAFIFASIFPDRIDMLISIDSVKPGIYTPNILIESLRQSLENTPKADQSNQEGVQKEYSVAEAIDRICFITFQSVTKETAPYLVRRGTIPSKKHPGKLIFTRDARIRYNFGFNFGHTMYIDLAKEIKIPHLIVKASKVPLIEHDKYFDETLKTMRENNSNFEYHEIDTHSHHLHLTEPEGISRIITDFIEKNKKVRNHL